MGAVSNSAGHHAEAVLPGEDVPGVPNGGRVYGSDVAGLPAGVLAERRHGPPGHAAVIADAVAAHRVPGPGGVSRPAGRGHVPVRLFVEAGGRTGVDRNAGNQDQQPAAVTQHTARPRRSPLPVVRPPAHYRRE